MTATDEDTVRKALADEIESRKHFYVGESRLVDLPLVTEAQRQTIIAALRAPPRSLPHSGEPVARCPTCNMTDAGYSVYIKGWCRDPWHGDDHLRASSPPATQIGGGVEAAREAIDRCIQVVAEQRCERGTPWDLACTTILDKLRALAPKPQRSVARAFYGAECPSYPNCSGGCGLGCTHEIETAKAARVVERCAQEAETWQGLKGRKLADRIRALSPTELHEGGK